MKIQRVNFSKLRNNEHFQCHTEFMKLVKEFNPQQLKIDQLFHDEYLPAYAEEDEAVLKIVKNSFTEARNEADCQRDNIFRGMIDTNKSALNHFDPDVMNSAKRLKILFDTYGNVARLPLQEETSAIYNLIQELENKYADDVKQVSLSNWKDKLQEYNNRYEELLKQGYEEEAAKTELKLKEVRTTIDKIYHRIVERLEALVVVEGEADYKEFFRRLNIQLDKHDNLLAQRQGRNAAKKIEGEK